MTSGGRPISARAVAALVALGLVGVAAGVGVGELLRPSEVLAGPASAVAAVGGPVEPEEPYAPDVDYPALKPDLEYVRKVFVDGFVRWRYQVPKGWVATPLAFGELAWRPPDSPAVGGYRVRVKPLNTHQSVEEMVEAKLEALQRGYDDLHIRVHTEDTLGFTYREASTSQKRYNTFRWIALPASDEAGFEMSVVGRERDLPGLTDLLTTVSASVEQVPPRQR